MRAQTHIITLFKQLQLIPFFILFHYFDSRLPIIKGRQVSTTEPNFNKLLLQTSASPLDTERLVMQILPCDELLDYNETKQI